MKKEVEALAQRIERADRLDKEILDAASKVLTGYLGASGKVAGMTVSKLTSSDDVILLVDETLPGWSVHINGKALEPNGHWHCNLRRTDTSEDIEFIAFGKGRVLQNVLLATLVRALGYLTEHRQTS